MKILVVGYGSIGKRHAQNVFSLGHDVVLLRHSKSQINKEGFKEYYSFEDLLKTEKKINGAIICSPTTKHLEDVKMLVRHNIPFLLEKPPAIDLRSTLKMKRLLQKNRFDHYDIAFNLRYYPALQFIKKFLPNIGRIYFARVWAGYYLPHWRRDIDYRQTTSAKKDLGGGVHIELVHEIDYILWFLGMPEKVFGYINKISDLEISSEDICSAIFQYKNGSIVELHLDYLTHKRLRGCQIIAEKGTLDWDFNMGEIVFYEKNNDIGKVLLNIDSKYNFNDTYPKELKHFIEIIEGKSGSKINIDMAVDIMKVLEAIKISSKKGKWITLKNIPNW